MKKLKLIDKTVFYFLILFAASLTNSIFVNQIGFYGALLFLLIKFGVRKENPFKKNGLEIYFILFLLAEVISASFSVNSPQAFHNFLKRLLLIPIVYVIASSVESIKQIKILFYVFVGFSLLSSFLYLWSSYSYYLNGLFQLKSSGPFLFHYPITTSELFSFSSMILFAFAIQNKISWKRRTFFLVSFLITTLSLLATFKRTGWIGFAAGLVVIILLRKQYIYLVAMTFVIAFVVFSQKNISKIEIFSFGENISKVDEINSEGLIYSLTNIDDELVTSSYTEGIQKIADGKLSLIEKFDSPVIDFKKWRNDYFVASLIDTRFVLLKKNPENKFSVIDYFMTKGMTHDFEIINGQLAIVDPDSGLTLFNNPSDINSKTIYSKIIGYKKLISIDSSLVLSNGSPEALAIKFNKDGTEILNENKFYSKSGAINSINSLNNEILIQTENKIFIADERFNINKSFRNSIPTILNIFDNNNKSFASLLGGEIVKLNFSDSSISKEKIISLGYNPQSLLAIGDSLYSAHLRRNRFSSIFDPYLSSNANRLAFWRAGLNMFLDNPVFGVGDIDLAKLYREYKRPFDKEIQGHMHNNFVHLLVILGSFGFVISMILLFKVFMFFINQLKITNDNDLFKTLIIGFIGSYIAFLVAGLTEWNFGDHEIISMVWFMVGMTAAIKNINAKNDSIDGNIE